MRPTMSPLYCNVLLHFRAEKYVKAIYVFRCNLLDRWSLKHLNVLHFAIFSPINCDPSNWCPWQRPTSGPSPRCTRIIPLSYYSFLLLASCWPPAQIEKYYGICVTLNQLNLRYFSPLRRQTKPISAATYVCSYFQSVISFISAFVLYLHEQSNK